jgi:hypothetical protein
MFWFSHSAGFTFARCGRYTAGHVAQCSWDHSARRGVVSRGDPCGSVDAAFAPRLDVPSSSAANVAGAGGGAGAGAGAGGGWGGGEGGGGMGVADNGFGTSFGTSELMSPTSSPMAVVELEYSTSLGLAVAVLASGKCAVLAVDIPNDGNRAAAGAGAGAGVAGGSNGLAPNVNGAGPGGSVAGAGPGGMHIVAERLRCERWVGGFDAVCARLSPATRTVAVGTRRGEVLLFHLGGGGGGGGGGGSPAAGASANADAGRHLRTFSLSDWGYTPEDTGRVSDLRWSADGSACAVGWSRRGLAVWSAAGLYNLNLVDP